MPETMAPPRKHIYCSRPRFYGRCCTSCHEDEDMGYGSLYWFNVEVAPGVSVGVHSCCSKRDQVDERVAKLTKRLHGSGRMW